MLCAHLKSLTTYQLTDLLTLQVQFDNLILFDQEPV